MKKKTTKKTLGPSSEAVLARKINYGQNAVQSSVSAEDKWHRVDGLIAARCIS